MHAQVLCTRLLPDLPPCSLVCLPAFSQWSSSLTPIKFVTLTDVVLTIKQGAGTVSGGD